MEPLEEHLKQYEIVNYKHAMAQRMKKKTQIHQVHFEKEEDYKEEVKHLSWSHIKWKKMKSRKENTKRK